MTGMTHRPNTARTLECILGLLAGLVVIWVVECGYPELEISSVITSHQSQLASRRDGYSGNTVAFKFRRAKGSSAGWMPTRRRGLVSGHTWLDRTPGFDRGLLKTYSRAAYSDTADNTAVKTCRAIMQDAVVEDAGEFLRNDSNFELQS
ncbi:hypothetical protein GQ600_14479 [Phytophthora cactorum]|nr:hypothetical protein GQ600_14479 [Phytophthora cactorum]